MTNRRKKVFQRCETTRAEFLTLLGDAMSNYAERAYDIETRRTMTAGVVLYWVEVYELPTEQKAINTNYWRG